MPATTNEHRGGPAGRPRPRRRPWPRPAMLAWALLVLVLLEFVALVWLDQLLRQAGRPDLAVVAPFAIAPSLAAAPAAWSACSSGG